MKIHSVGTELYHADRQTYRQTGITKLIVTFRNFANAPKTKRRYSLTWLLLYVLTVGGAKLAATNALRTIWHT